MGLPATTRLSSKGQVVIPEEVRQKLRLLPGVQFLVLGEGDVVILKVISPPSIAEFDGLIAEARSQARRSGLRKGDVAGAVSRARAKK
ncbi:AbrB/MazE/SpoVT family DNA-binding domain-containing protein [bacterium]|nr:AbrB/MazE/SpoVT family DNA-binding domain-containing protein [bacterium]